MILANRLRQDFNTTDQASKMKSLKLIFFISMVTTSYHAKAANEPAYLEHRSDFVQQVYSQVVIGFSFERKCNYLSEVQQAEYLKHLNISTEIFQGYILAKEMIQSPEEALSYPKSIVLSAVRYAESQYCDSDAKKRVDSGFDAAKNFMAIIDQELRKDIAQ